MVDVRQCKEGADNKYIGHIVICSSLRVSPTFGNSCAANASLYDSDFFPSLCHCRYFRERLGEVCSVLLAKSHSKSVFEVLII